MIGSLRPEPSEMPAGASSFRYNGISPSLSAPAPPLVTITSAPEGATYRLPTLAAIRLLLCQLLIVLDFTNDGYLASRRACRGHSRPQYWASCSIVPACCSSPSSPSYSS